MENQVWKHKAPCSYSQHICFEQVLYRRCYYQHSQQNADQMRKLWGDLKHKLRREMEETEVQTKSACQSGINCYYLLMGDCRHQHSTFDLKWAYNIRRQLFQIKCPIQGCYVKSCVYGHDDINNQLFKLSEQKLKKLYKEAKKRQTGKNVQIKKQIKVSA